MARSLEALSVSADVVRRLLLTNAGEVSELAFSNDGLSVRELFNAPSFAYLMEQCQNLKALTLERIHLKKNIACAWGFFEARPRDHTDFVHIYA
jgi:hypothetical protein